MADTFYTTTEVDALIANLQQQITALQQQVQKPADPPVPVAPGASGGPAEPPMPVQPGSTVP